MALAAAPESGSTVDLLIRWGIGGAVYGGFLAVSPPKTGRVDDLKQGYDTTRPMRTSGFGRTAHYAWPFIAIGIVVVLVLIFGDIAPDVSFFVWFWLIIALRELTLFPAVGPFWKRPNVIGMALLIGAMLLNYASTSSTSA